MIGYLYLWCTLRYYVHCTLYNNSHIELDICTPGVHSGIMYTAHCTKILTYDWISVPLVYTQVFCTLYSVLQFLHMIGYLCPWCTLRYYVHFSQIYILKWWKTLFCSLDTLLLKFKCFIVTFNENFKSYNLKKYSVFIL